MNSRRVFTTAICAVLACSTISTAVLGQTTPGAMSGNGDGLLPPSSETTVDQSQGAGRYDVGFDQSCCSRWTASAEFIILQRVGSFNQTLVETVPRTQPPSDPGTQVLNATDLHQGFSGGPRLGLIHHGDDGNDLEVSYFQIDGWSDYRSVGPTPNDWLVMRAPGGFLQTQDNQNTQMMAWDYASRLYNAEVNVRWNLWPRMTVLAGFRWVNLTEELQGTLPPERTAPFWDTQTKNNLYGFQIGAEERLFERGRFSIGCTGKAGLFENHVDEATSVSIYRVQFGESASTDHLAFLGEIGVGCTYRVTPRLSLKAGYQAFWLQGVALAPAQIPETYTHSSLILQDTYVQALGVNCSSGVLYHGATVGLEYAF